MEQQESVTGLSLVSRLLLLGASAAGISLFVIASSLEPDVRGWGTHEQLGLTPCYFRQQFKLPCPTCGMTTAWVYVARGAVAQAASANLAGTLLSIAVGLAVPWSLISSVRGKWFIGVPATSTWMLLLGLWLGVVFMDWLRRCLPI